MTASLRNWALGPAPPNVDPWESLVRKIKNPKHQVTIGITGKYVDLTRILQELCTSRRSMAAASPTTPRSALQYISADGLEDGTELEKLDNRDGILVPGGLAAVAWRARFRR